MSERPESRTIEEALWKKVEIASKTLKGYRKPKIEDVFNIGRYYLGPEDFKITNYIRSRPWSAFNPGALKRGDKVYIFPRLVFEFYAYVSSAGVCSIDIENLLNGKIEKPLDTKIILWPKYPWEQLGCEDPRIFEKNEKIYILYCGRGYYRLADGKTIKNDALGLAILNKDWEILKRGFFYVKKGEEKHVPSNRDTAFLNIQGNEATMVTRPVIRGVKLCWRAKANIEEFSIYEEDLEPVFAPEDWESHIGWSTNAVKLSNTEYLVGWHGVSRYDFTYRNGLAIVNESGELLAISNYVLSPIGIYEEYGDRPFTLFGNGLIKHKEFLIWIGGIGDCCIGIFITKLEKALEKLKWIKP